MARLMAAALVRVGLAMLVLAILVRLLPMPNQADVVAADLSIAVSLLLVLAPSIYLRVRKEQTNPAVMKRRSE
jgi:hypothetical protein